MRAYVLLPTGLKMSVDHSEAIVRKYLADHAAVSDLYDGTNPGPHDDVTPMDVLALNALNAFVGAAPMDPMAALWGKRTAIQNQIAKVNLSRLDVTDLTGDEVRSETDKVSQVLTLIEHTHGWGPTRAAKLLHRLRPGLVPIWDELVGEWYGCRAQPWPEYLQAVFSDVRREPTRNALHAMQGRCCPHLTALRIWDIILWKLKYDSHRSPKPSMGA
jgi:hypothetical protein